MIINSMFFILLRCFWLMHITKKWLITAEIEIRGFTFVHNSQFDDMILDHGLLWDIASSTTITCAIHCANDVSCISLHFNKQCKKCRGYETLMLSSMAGKNETDWIYFYFTKPGVCPNRYAYTRKFAYCFGFEGTFGDDVGETKCRDKNGRYMLIRSAEENRFASLLAYNYNKSNDTFHRQMRIQGTFNDTVMAWQDDRGQNLSFTQFIEGKEIPSSDKMALFIKMERDAENYSMTCRFGNRNPSMTVCII